MQITDILSFIFTTKIDFEAKYVINYVFKDDFTIFQFLFLHEFKQ